MELLQSWWVSVIGNEVVSTFPAVFLCMATAPKGLVIYLIYCSFKEWNRIWFVHTIKGSPHTFCLDINTRHLYPNFKHELFLKIHNMCLLAKTSINYRLFLNILYFCRHTFHLSFFSNIYVRFRTGRRK